MRKSLGGCLAAAVVLLGCGGGGGGGSAGDNTLLIDASWGAPKAYLFHSITVTPALSGFEGHAPRCSMANGELPPGMQLRGDCVIEGRPTRPGSYVWSVRVGAGDAVGTVDFPATLEVVGPVLFYPGRHPDTLVAGMQLQDPPSLGEWTAPADAGATWSFNIIQGALPAGLSLNPGTGVISGTVTAPGNYFALIQGTLATSYGSEGPLTTGYGQEAGTPTFAYPPNDPARQEHRAYTSLPVSLTPEIRLAGPGSTLSNFALAGSVLPEGLVLDPDTGRISGVPTTASRFADNRNITVTATVRSSALVSTATTTFLLSTMVPGHVAFDPPTLTTAVGAPVDVTTRMTSAVGASFAPVISYAIDSIGCQRAPGVSLDLATARIHGTPTATGTFSCFLDATFSNAGVSWQEMIVLEMRVQ